MHIHDHNKQHIKPYLEVLRDFDPIALAQEVDKLFDQQALLQLGYPFETLKTPTALLDIYNTLHQAMPDLERRDTIIMGGTTNHGGDWIGCCGYYTGTFLHPWLDIPPTGHQATMRFHEFYNIKSGKVIELQALWDIPELMFQAQAWPMAKPLGANWYSAAPATQDGLSLSGYDETVSNHHYKRLLDMIDGLHRYATHGAKGMELERYFAPKLSWYGPAGIGTCRGISGFRHWHQIPFLKALPDRRGDATKGHCFADGHYVAFTAWPGMHMSISGDGWLGIPPSQQNITMRSLDFWRYDKGLIAENWVLVDLLHVYHQIGVDVLGRMREFNKARYGMNAYNASPY